MNLKKFDDTRDVYIPPDQDVWYILEYERVSGSVIMTYYNQSLPLTRQEPIHKLIKHTYTGSVIDAVFSKCLNNFQIKREEYSKEYEPVRTYTKPTSKGASWDLTDISNNIKPMPQDFRNFMFTVSGRNSRLTIQTWVTKADIDRESLNVIEMNHYLSSLKDFELVDRKAGWPKI
jgi:hypothetical protein